MSKRKSWRWLRGPLLVRDEQTGLWRGRTTRGLTFTVTHAALYRHFEETLTYFLQHNSKGRDFDEAARMAWDYARQCCHWTHKVGRVAGVEAYEPSTPVPPRPSLYEQLQGMIA